MLMRLSFHSKKEEAHTWHRENKGLLAPDFDSPVNKKKHVGKRESKNPTYAN